MKVTVSQLPDQPEALVESFEALVGHVKNESSELVLLPEMPFYPWLAESDSVDESTWKAAVDAHEEWSSGRQTTRLPPGRGQED